MGMIDRDAWLDELLAKLRDRFGGRLLFLGLQGSCRRDEQREDSDFDAVVILDCVALSDLAAYRAIVEGMPEPEKACGFIGGGDELLAWPKHELFQFIRDTVPCFGNLGALVPGILEKDIREAVRIGASDIYHAVCHTYVHADPKDQAGALRDLYKKAYFVLVQAHFLHTGVYVGTRKALTRAMAGKERRILEIGNDWERCKADRDENPDAFFELLLEWSGSLIRTI